MSTEPLENFEELARRAVACPRWRWMPGMLYNHPKDRPSLALRPEGPNAPIILCGPGGGLPIFSDPATLGCLLALVREAWGRGVYLLPDGGWYVKGARLKDGASVNLGICAASEEEALVAALEAAP